MRATRESVGGFVELRLPEVMQQGAALTESDMKVAASTQVARALQAAARGLFFLVPILFGYAAVGQAQAAPCADNRECSVNEYCARDLLNCMGDGVCLTRPQICTEEYLPVCGCDGSTYSNACRAAAAGVNIAFTGPCVTPQCGGELPTFSCMVNGKPGQACVGTSGPDVIVGSAARDVIVGLEAADQIFGEEGDDLICGGADEMLNDDLGDPGNGDFIMSGDGNDTVYGGGLGALHTGNDSLFGDQGCDTLYGQDGDDKLWGGSNGAECSDALYGGPGNDTLEGQAGNDELFGGDQTDILIGNLGDDELFGEGGDGDRCDGGPESHGDFCEADSSCEIVQNCEQTRLFPDLFPLAARARMVLGVCPPVLCADTPVEIFVDVENRGEEAVSGAQVAVQSDESSCPPFRFAMPMLFPGEHQERLETVCYTSFAGGGRALVDPDNLIEESNETNNSISITLNLVDS